MPYEKNISKNSLKINLSYAFTNHFLITNLNLYYFYLKRANSIGDTGVKWLSNTLEKISVLSKLHINLK